MWIDGFRALASRASGAIEGNDEGHRAKYSRTVDTTTFVLKRRASCYIRSIQHHRAIDLAKAKRIQRWQRDPEGMRLRILEAAKQEFAAHGLAGARVDRIAANAGANKRMLYYHVGNKEDLYLEVLEGAYEKIRAEERTLDLEHLDPPEAIGRLIDFTWNYFLRNPEFLALLNTENLAKAKHLKRSTKVKSMHSPFVEMIRTVVTRGVESGDFRVVGRSGAALYLDRGACVLLSLQQRHA